eukprot:scaffold131457_cov51-Phaeocystis_antarctica.AAC.1
MRSASGGGTRSTLQWGVQEVRLRHDVHIHAAANPLRAAAPPSPLNLHPEPDSNTNPNPNSRCASRFLLSRTPPSSSSSTRASASTEQGPGREEAS